MLRPFRPRPGPRRQLVRWRSPALAVERTRIDAARADRITAGALPNPTVSGRHQPGRRDAPGERELAIEQPLPVFGQRGYRIRNAELGVGAAQAQVALGTAEVLRDAAQAYVALQVAQARETRWREALADVEAAERIVAGQVEARARSRYERTRVEMERAALSAQAEAMQAARAQAASRLAALAGAPGWQPQAEGQPACPHHRRRPACCGPMRRSGCRPCVRSAPKRPRPANRSTWNGARPGRCRCWACR